MTDNPCYPITIYYRDSGEWKESESYDSEMDLVVGLEFADTEEVEDAWAIKAVDKYDREVSLKVEAIELVRFELSKQMEHLGSEPLGLE